MSGNFALSVGHNALTPTSGEGKSMVAPFAPPNALIIAGFVSSIGFVILIILTIILIYGSVRCVRLNRSNSRQQSNDSKSGLDASSSITTSDRNSLIDAHTLSGHNSHDGRVSFDSVIPSLQQPSSDVMTIMPDIAGACSSNAQHMMSVLNSDNQRNDDESGVLNLMDPEKNCVTSQIMVRPDQYQIQRLAPSCYPSTGPHPHHASGQYFYQLKSSSLTSSTPSPLTSSDYDHGTSSCHSSTQYPTYFNRYLQPELQELSDMTMIPSPSSSSTMYTLNQHPSPNHCSLHHLSQHHQHALRTQAEFPSPLSSTTLPDVTPSGHDQSHQELFNSQYQDPPNGCLMVYGHDRDYQHHPHHQSQNQHFFGNLSSDRIDSGQRDSGLESSV